MAPNALTSFAVAPERAARKTGGGLGLAKMLEVTGDFIGNLYSARSRPDPRRVADDRTAVGDSPPVWRERWPEPLRRDNIRIAAAIPFFTVGMCDPTADADEIRAAFGAI
jgi:hypothetical protein